MSINFHGDFHGFREVFLPMYEKLLNLIHSYRVKVIGPSCMPQTFKPTKFATLTLVDTLTINAPNFFSN